jgi:hypothetical protein
MPDVILRTIMLITWKNKGLVVIMYLLVSFFGVAIITGILQRNLGGAFLKIDFYSTVGTAFLISSIWTYLTKDDYFEDKNGDKKKMEIVNDFFFIRMEIWAFIYFLAALLFLGNSIFNYFGK